MSDTKVFIELQIKDFPAGKKIKCHFWLKGEGYSKTYIEKYIKENLSLDEYYKNYVIHDIKVFNPITTNTRKSTDNYGVITMDIITILFSKDTKKEEEKKNLRTLKLSDYKTEDIEYLNKKIHIELLMRKYNFNDDEYKFYIANKDEVNIENVKEIYKKCSGDIFKLRKNKIRENITNIIK